MEPVLGRSQRDGVIGDAGPVEIGGGHDNDDAAAFDLDVEVDFVAEELDMGEPAAQGRAVVGDAPIAVPVPERITIGAVRDLLIVLRLARTVAGSVSSRDFGCR